MKRAARAYTKKHGGSFFYEEPGNGVIYENARGECFSFDNSLTNEVFAAALESSRLPLFPAEELGAGERA